MSSETFSANGAIVALRDQLEVRLNQLEDYRAFKALEQILKELGVGSVVKAATYPAAARRIGAGSDAPISQFGVTQFAQTVQPNSSTGSNTESTDSIAARYSAHAAV